jgi:anaerobic dimethyl sulfoxide reductase subunit C (anchor subunit)
MDIKELSLVLFTVIMQMAIGAFCILGGVHFFASRRNGPEEADKLSDRALVAIGPLAVFALLVTLFHLGNPLNAPRAILNFGSSWLSREIVLAVAFSGGGALFALLQWRKLGSAGLRNALALLVAAVGLVLVYAMSQVYQLASVPAWHSLNTPVSFYTTTLLLGALAMGAAFVVNFWYVKRNQMDPANVQYSMLATSLRYIALLAMAMMGIQFIVMPLYFASLSTAGNAAASASLNVIFGEHGVLLAVRLLLLFVGAGLLSLFVYQLADRESKLRLTGNLAYLAFALVLVSEILGRFLFYESMVRIGL